MSLERMAQQLAEEFHDTYERLAPSFGYQTRQDTRAFDLESPNGRLMVAVCRQLLYKRGAKLGASEVTK